LFAVEVGYFLLGSKLNVENTEYKVSATKLNEENYSFFENNCEYFAIKYNTGISFIN
jgi:hypothetical protein